MQHMVFSGRQSRDTTPEPQLKGGVGTLFRVMSGGLGIQDLLDLLSQCIFVLGCQFY